MSLLLKNMMSWNESNYYKDLPASDKISYKRRLTLTVGYTCQILCQLNMKNGNKMKV